MSGLPMRASDRSATASARKPAATTTRNTPDMMHTGRVGGITEERAAGVGGDHCTEMGVGGHG